MPEVEAHELKVAEFRLTLDGWAARWRPQLDLTAFTTFDQLQSSFLRFFHRSVPEREVIGHFFTIKQLPKEFATDFSLRFQSLRCQLTWAPIKEEAKDTFLVALR